MYGMILKMCGDETTANTIFEKIVITLNAEYKQASLQVLSCSSVVKSTYMLTLKHLKILAAQPATVNPFDASFPIINGLCLGVISLKNITLEHTTPQSAKKELWEEFNQLRRRQSDGNN